MGATGAFRPRCWPRGAARESPPPRARRARLGGDLPGRPGGFVPAGPPARGLGGASAALRAGPRGGRGADDSARRLRLHRDGEGQTPAAHPGQANGRVRTGGGPAAEPVHRRKSDADRIPRGRLAGDRLRRPRQLRRAQPRIPTDGQRPMDRHRRLAGRDAGGAVSSRHPPARGAREGSLHPRLHGHHGSVRQVRPQGAHGAFRGTDRRDRERGRERGNLAPGRARRALPTRRLRAGAGRPPRRPPAPGTASPPTGWS